MAQVAAAMVPALGWDVVRVIVEFLQVREAARVLCSSKCFASAVDPCSGFPSVFSRAHVLDRLRVLLGSSPDSVTIMLSDTRIGRCQHWSELMLDYALDIAPLMIERMVELGYNPVRVLPRTETCLGDIKGLIEAAVQALSIRVNMPLDSGKSDTSLDLEVWRAVSACFAHPHISKQVLFLHLMGVEPDPELEGFTSGFGPLEELPDRSSEAIELHTLLWFKDCAALDNATLAEDEILQVLVRMVALIDNSEGLSAVFSTYCSVKPFSDLHLGFPLFIARLVDLDTPNSVFGDFLVDLCSPVSLCYFADSEVGAFISACEAAGIAFSSQAADWALYELARRFSEAGPICPGHRDDYFERMTHAFEQVLATGKVTRSGVTDLPFHHLMGTAYGLCDLVLSLGVACSLLDGFLAMYVGSSDPQQVSRATALIQSGYCSQQALHQASTLCLSTVRSEHLIALIDQTSEYVGDLDAFTEAQPGYVAEGLASVGAHLADREVLGTELLSMDPHSLVLAEVLDGATPGLLAQDVVTSLVLAFFSCGCAQCFAPFRLLVDTGNRPTQRVLDKLALLPGPDLHPSFHDYFASLPLSYFTLRAAATQTTGLVCATAPARLLDFYS